MRAVHQATELRLAGCAEPSVRRALRGFAGRLRWHCHFMQKLEAQPNMEFRNLASAYDGRREGAFDRARFAAWRDGQTGYPMVDACMRYLRASGWLNFRMRAMLASFAAYHLWLHWREPGLFLARQFLDFEPGIHWSQLQMQSGTTGINTFRIYSPTKQAHDQDPDGHFIRRWVPELAHVPLPLLAEPWRMAPSQQRKDGCVIDTDYPAPIVDERSALAHARERVHGVCASCPPAAPRRRRSSRCTARAGWLASRRSGPHACNLRHRLTCSNDAARHRYLRFVCAHPRGGAGAPRRRAPGRLRAQPQCARRRGDAAVTLSQPRPAEPARGACRRGRASPD